MENTAFEGVSRLYEYGGIVILLLLCVIVLLWFCKYLLNRNQELTEKFITVVVENIKILAEFKEALRENNRKG